MKTVHIDKLNKIFPNAYFDLYNSVSEPGYDDQPTILADWNPVPNVVYDRLEQLGYNCFWYDEWSSCSDCGNLFRVSPDSYDWTPSYVVGDGEMWCLECVDPEEHYESIENNPKTGVNPNFTRKYPPEKYGYEKLAGDYRNGLHIGDDDNPVKILGKLPHGTYIFVIDYTSQFTLGFSVYKKIRDSHFDRFDICEAYYVLESDFNVGGKLQERRISAHTQLHKIQFKANPFIKNKGYSALTDNGKAIYDAFVARHCKRGLK